MNIYDDYISYLGEHMDIITALKDSDSPVLSILHDVIRVTDYIYQQYSKKKPIDEDMEEIFSLGYGYLSNTLTDIKMYYEEYFNKNIERLNRFSTLIIDLIILDDFKAFLDVNERLDMDTSNEIDDLMNKIDVALENKNPDSIELVENVELYIEDKTPLKLDFRPVYIVFAMIAEELSITDERYFS